MKKHYSNVNIKSFDIWLFSLATILSLFGIIMIASAAKSLDNSDKYVIVQFVALAAGILLLYFITVLDYEHISAFSKYIYVGGFVLLILILTPLGTGRAETGGQSWFRLGFLGFQPAEIVKIGFIITFAKHLDTVKDDINKMKNVALLTLHFAVFILLIELQPDTGTAMVFTVIFLSMLFIAGINYKYILSALGVFAVSAPILWFFILQQFQKNRILALINPAKYSLNYGYQVMQSKIAIGSGQIFGKGLFKGTQTQLGILPEKQTDFIFAVIGEELGLIGCILVIAVLIAIIYRCIKIGKIAKDSMGSYICVGVASMFMVQTFENVGMCLGIMPVAGITLPFLSYGGSSLLTNFAAIGLVLSVQLKNRASLF